MFLTSRSNSCHRHSGSVLFNQPQALNTLNSVFMIFLRRCTTNSCASHADPVTTWHLADTTTLAELSQFTWIKWPPLPSPAPFIYGQNIWTANIRNGTQRVGCHQISSWWEEVATRRFYPVISCTQKSHKTKGVLIGGQTICKEFWVATGWPNCIMVGGG